MRFNERDLLELGMSKADVATLRAILDHVTGLDEKTTEAGITAAAGGGQAAGTAIIGDINEVSTVVTAGDSVTLPTAVPGYYILIINKGAEAMDVFPAASDNLGAGVDTAVSLAAGTNITYASYDVTNWVTVV
jgi:hypothetical protein